MSNAYKLWDRWPPSRNRDIVPLWHRRAHRQAHTHTDMGELTQVRLIKWVKIIMAIRRPEEVVFGLRCFFFLWIRCASNSREASGTSIGYNNNRSRGNMKSSWVFDECWNKYRCGKITGIYFKRTGRFDLWLIIISCYPISSWQIVCVSICFELLHYLLYQFFNCPFLNFPFRTRFH